MRRAAPADPMPMPILAPVSSPPLSSSLPLVEFVAVAELPVDVAVDDERVVVVAAPAPAPPATLVVVAGLKSLVHVMEPPAAVGTVFLCARSVGAPFHEDDYLEQALLTLGQGRG